MLRELYHLRARHIHKRVDFSPPPLEVLDTEGVDGDGVDAGIVADFEDSSKGFETEVVPFDGFEVVRFGVASVAVHDEGDVARDGAAF